MQPDVICGPVNCNMLQAEISYIEWGHDEGTPLAYVHAYIALLQPRSWVVLWNGCKPMLRPADVKGEVMRL